MKDTIGLGNYRHLQKQKQEFSFAQKGNKLKEDPLFSNTLTVFPKESNQFSLLGASQKLSTKARNKRMDLNFVGLNSSKNLDIFLTTPAFPVPTYASRPAYSKPTYPLPNSQGNKTEWRSSLIRKDLSGLTNSIKRVQGLQELDRIIQGNKKKPFEPISFSFSQKIYASNSGKKASPLKSNPIFAGSRARSSHQLETNRNSIGNSEILSKQRLDDFRFDLLKSQNNLSRNNFFGSRQECTPFKKTNLLSEEMMDFRAGLRRARSVASQTQYSDNKKRSIFGEKSPSSRKSIHSMFSGPRYYSKIN